MTNLFLEIERLKSILRSRGLEEDSIEMIAKQAEQEIASALRGHMESALDSAIGAGVQRDSANFINDLRPNIDAFILETESGATDFSEPPYPMLDRLLSGAKPMKDGSGVYKVIPVGSPSKTPRKPIHTNIFDAQKAIAAQRHEEAASQYSKVIPSGSKAQFRTATSKQSRRTQWVLPAKDKDFTEDLQVINNDLRESREETIRSIIRSYEESY